MKNIVIAIVIFITSLFGFASTSLALDNYDLNQDGVVDIFDYNLFLGQKGQLTEGEFAEFKANFGKLITSNPIPPTQSTGIKVGVLFGGLASDNHTKRNETEGVMAFPEWKDRLPYFTVVRSKDTLTINQDDQRVVDQEIELASAAGLDYWVFEGFPGNYASSSNYGIKMYLNSPKKALLQYALLISTERFTDPKNVQKNIETLTPYFKDGNYLKWNNRPVLFLFTLDRVVKEIGKAETVKYLKDLKKNIKSQIGYDPYLVLNDSGSQTSMPTAADFDFDARSSYLGSENFSVKGKEDNNYALLADYNQSVWAKYASSNLDYIPTAAMGLDARPKLRNALFHDWSDNSPWVQQGTPAQLAEQVNRAVSWAKNNKNVAKAQLVMVAHWSSIAEGQWLIPTLTEGNARLNAIAKVLNGKQMSVPTSPYADGSLPALPPGTLTITGPKKMTGFNRDSVIHVTGSAPFASRINLKMNNNNRFFINVKGGLGGDKDSYNFDVEFPAPSEPGRYTLSISSLDTTNKIDVSNIIIK